MANASSIARTTTCPTCNRLVITDGFAFHRCDGDYVVTVNGAFHASFPSDIQARTYVYAMTRRHDAAGIHTTMHLSEAEPERDEYTIWYDAANDALDRGAITSLYEWPGLRQAQAATRSAV